MFTICYESGEEVGCDDVSAADLPGEIEALAVETCHVEKLTPRWSLDHRGVDAEVAWSFAVTAPPSLPGDFVVEVTGEAGYRRVDSFSLRFPVVAAA